MAGSSGHTPLLQVCLDTFLMALASYAFMRRDGVAAGTSKVSARVFVEITTSCVTTRPYPDDALHLVKSGPRMTFGDSCARVRRVHDSRLYDANTTASLKAFGPGIEGFDAQDVDSFFAFAAASASSTNCQYREVGMRS